MEDFSYGDGAPDAETNETEDFEYYYNYGDGSPDTAREKFDYDGEVASPCAASRGGNTRSTRRSSMKQGGAPRRSSIGYSGEIIVNLPGINRPVKRRTSITFDKKEQIREVASMSSLTDDPKELWFQAEEFRKIHKNARMITYIAIRGGDGMLKSKQLCIRGLERHINNKFVQEEQSIARQSVLLEQYHQRESGSSDEDMVAKVYHLASMQSQARARIRGCEDEANIISYTRHARRMMRRSSM